MAEAAGAAWTGCCWSNVRWRCLEQLGCSARQWLPEQLVLVAAGAVIEGDYRSYSSGARLWLSGQLVTVAAGAARCWGPGTAGSAPFSRSARPRPPEQPGCVAAEAASCRSSLYQLQPELQQYRTEAFEAACDCRSAGLTLSDPEQLG
jgi:hypothetical protein